MSTYRSLLSLGIVLTPIVMLPTGCSSHKSASGSPPHYTVFDLGVLGGENGCGASINNHGQVVGRLGRSISDAQPFLYTNGKIVKIGPHGGQMAIAAQINDSGEVIGTVDPYSDASGELSHAFVWQKGHFQRIDTPRIKLTSAGSVNREGDIVGTAQFGTQHTSGFLWQRGKIFELVSSSGTSSFPVAVNDADQVVGSCGPNAVVWLNGSQNGQQIGPGTARSINNKGQVVGNSGSTAFLWENGVLIHLGLLGNHENNNQNSVAFSINDQGQVVGLSTPANRTAATKYNHAFLWQNGQMYDLNSLIPSGSPFEVTVGSAINNRGQILCSAILSGKSHTVILTPTK